MFLFRYFTTFQDGVPYGDFTAAQFAERFYIFNPLYRVNIKSCPKRFAGKVFYIEN